jgi:hypothetical protein
MRDASDSLHDGCGGVVVGERSREEYGADEEFKGRKRKREDMCWRKRKSR